MLRVLDDQIVSIFCFACVVGAVMSPYVWFRCRKRFSRVSDSSWMVGLPVHTSSHLMGGSDDAGLAGEDNTLG